MTTSPSTFGDITLCLRNGSKSSEPVDVRERKRRYSQELYRYTMQMWDQNRADIERRSSTEALNALAGLRPSGNERMPSGFSFCAVGM